MILTLVTPPATLPLSLSDMKLHARIDVTDDDSLVSGFIKAATERLDGRDGSLGICLITQTWKLSLDGFPSEISIPLRPCQSIDSITYLDGTGTLQTLAALGYRATGLGSMDGARIASAYGTSWPATIAVADAVTITFTAGFGSTSASIPEPLRLAVAMRAAHLYEHRESVTDSDGYTRVTPDGPDDFTINFKQFVF